MAHITACLRSVLDSPAVYDAFQNLMGADSGRLELVNEFIRPTAGMRILDIGCGTARIVEYLPKIDYYGFDMSERYITAARRRYGSRGHFQCAQVEHATLDGLPPFDVVLASGVMHHLDDNSTLGLLALAKHQLRAEGRLITIDPCYDNAQNPVARFLVSRDRGHYVRSGNAYRDLAGSVFPSVKALIRHRAWIPYSHCILECSR